MNEAIVMYSDLTCYDFSYQQLQFVLVRLMVSLKFNQTWIAIQFHCICSCLFTVPHLIFSILLPSEGHACQNYNDQPFVYKKYQQFLNHMYTWCSKSHAPPSLTRYILRYESSIAIKEVCLDRVTLHNCCDTKHDPIDDFLNKLPQFKRISLKLHNT